MIDRTVPARVGPVELTPFGAKWVAVRCPSEFDLLMRLLASLGSRVRSAG